MSERNRLLELLTELAYERRKVVLSSGKESDFYIDTKQASLTAEGHYLVGRLVLAEIRGHFAGAQAVGGMTLGADPIADPSAGREFFEHATSKDKKQKRYDGLLHELFHEPERDAVFRDVIGWLDERAQSKEPRAATAEGG